MSIDQPYTSYPNEGKIVRNSDGKVILPCQDTNDPDVLIYEAWAEAGGTPVVVYIPPPPDHRRITKLAFRNRLGNQAKVKMTLMSVINPADTDAQKAVAAQVQVFIGDLNDATHVDLARADTAEILSALVQMQIIDEAKKEAVLTAPIQAHEVWNGS